MRCITLFLLAVLVSILTQSCVRPGRIVKTRKGMTLTPPTQSEQPSTVTDSTTNQAITLPSGSTIQVVSSPATATSPESTQTTYTLAKDSTQTLRQSSQTVSLSPTRKPDDTVELHKADLAERRIILYAAIVCFVGGIAIKALMPAWPGASTTAWVASGILFAAWKFSEVPWWASLGAIGLYVAIALGFKRGEVDAKKQS